MTTAVRVARGSLHLTKEVYDRYFMGLDAVVLQRRGADLLVLPVRHTPAGGYVLKHRNARGDRVAVAADFFRAHGFDDERERHAATRWDDAASGLLADGIFEEDGRADGDRNA